MKARKGTDLNHLFFLLPTQMQERLIPKLRETELPIGKKLYTAHQDVKFVYFPVDCITCLVRVTLDGHSSEIAIVGCEGAVGIPELLGGGMALSDAIVGSPGTAYRLAAADLKVELENDASTLKLMLRYSQLLLTEIAQIATCNRFHSIDQQLCRWLLQCLDKVTVSKLAMSQELIGAMLGVRRESVTNAASRLRDLGVIDYRRGQITVLDRQQLEARCCECYTVIRQETERLGLDCDWCDNRQKVG